MDFMGGASRTESTTSPISRLSDDVLRMIFTCTTRSSQAWSGIDKAINLSHVSGRWRALALDTASLWAEITWHHRKFVAIQRAHSRTVPLSISWQMDDPCKNADIDLLIHILDENINRLRCLDLFLGLKDLNDVLGHLFSETPRLEELALGLNLEYDDLDDEEFAPRMFNEQDIPNLTPKLRRLKLKDIVIPWPRSASRLPSLTHLEIVYTSLFYVSPCWSDDWLTLPDLRDMLSKMPKLEVLKLSSGILYPLQSEEGLNVDSLLPLSSPDASISTATPIPSTRDTIDLPALRLLDVGVSDPQSAVELSRHLSVHPQCLVSYVCGFFDPGLLDISFSILVRNLFPRCTIRHSPRKFKLEVLRCVYDDANSAYSLHVSGTLHEDEDFNVYLENIPNVDLTSVVHAACQLYDLTHLRSLYIQLDQFAVAEEIWRDIFESCSELEDLEVSEDVMKAFLPSLENSGTTASSCSLPFPALQLVSLICPQSLAREDEERLASSLRRRKERNFELDTLSMTTVSDDMDWTGCAGNLKVKVIDF